MAVPLLAVDLGLAGGGPCERLLVGLTQSIRERGLAGTQITHIVANARTSRSTFYKCFEDKDAGLSELVRLMTNVGLAEVKKAVAGLGPRGVALQQEGVERYASLMRRLSGRAALRRAGVSQLTMDTAAMLVGGINAMVVRAIECGDSNRGRLVPIAIRVVQAALTP
jgi:AcrR family transcriptional regulator